MFLRMYPSAREHGSLKQFERGVPALMPSTMVLPQSSSIHRAGSLEMGSITLGSVERIDMRHTTWPMATWPPEYTLGGGKPTGRS